MKTTTTSKSSLPLLLLLLILILLGSLQHSADAFSVSSPGTAAATTTTTTSREEEVEEVSSSSPSSASSRALQSILGEQSIDYFFDKIWQKHPHVYNKSDDDKRYCDDEEETNDDSNNNNNPLYDQVTMGLPGIVQVLENACETFQQQQQSLMGSEWQVLLPMVFNPNKTSLSLEELKSRYNNNLFDAYLDGCSIVLNHCDRLCPNTAALCEELQQSFPYSYANAYLTPPASQTVQAHADDRDVFVIQVYGQKSWKVYTNVPIQYPYPHEQVGKNGIPVPNTVVEGPTVVDTILHPGDVLYIPRGYVHEACTTHQENENETKKKKCQYHPPSYHITIALPTFAWSYSELISTAVRKTLDTIPDYKMAIPIDFGRIEKTTVNDIPFVQQQLLEQRIKEAFEVTRQELTLEAIHHYMKQKHYYHASKSRPARLHRIGTKAKATTTATTTTEEKKNRKNNIVVDTNNNNNGGQNNHDGSSSHCVSVTGQDAVELLTMSSLIRAAAAAAAKTPSDEKVTTTTAIREETAATLQTIVDYLKSNPSQTIQVSELSKPLSEKCKYICDLTLLSYVRNCIERGELAIVG